MGKIADTRRALAQHQRALADLDALLAEGEPVHADKLFVDAAKGRRVQERANAVARSYGVFVKRLINITARPKPGTTSR
jgi:hypothetical protein